MLSIVNPIVGGSSNSNSLMAIKRLGEKNIEVLLNQYRSERKRLIFQLNRVRDTIAQLKSMRAKEPPAPAEGVAVKRGPGRPRKNADPAASTAAVARSRKKKLRGGGYRLNKWDEMILGHIRKVDRLLPKEDLLKQTITWAAKHEPRMTAEEVETKLTRVLQKLSGKRGDLGTHRSGLRRGYHYGLKEWFFASSGALRKQHLVKLDPKK